MIQKGLFITSTGTGEGKTFVTRGIARGLSDQGRSVVAIKPVETGCRPLAVDAEALGRACGRPDLARARGLYRAELPLSPYAAALRTGTSMPAIDALAASLRELSKEAEIVLIEAAGGLLVPLDRERTMADLALSLGFPLLVVVRDRLGVISHTLAVFESAAARSLEVAGLVLARHEPGPEEIGPGTNRQILSERLRLPVYGFSCCGDDDLELARAAACSGLMELFAGR